VRPRSPGTRTAPCVERRVWGAPSRPPRDPRSEIAIPPLIGLSVPAFAESDPVAGEKVFITCEACHMIGDGARNKIGLRKEKVRDYVASYLMTFE